MIPSPDHAAGNILIIDDLPDNLRLLSEMLTRRGYRVYSAITYSAAFMSMSTTLPDLILLDINMPMVNGYEVCNILKADERTREIPVIFLSAYDGAIDKVKAFQVGGLDYITKPFQVEEVLARVATHLALSRTRKELAQAKAEALEALAQEQQLNRLKSEFVALVSHDFLTPLVGIRGFTDLLRQRQGTGTADDLQERYLRKIEGSVEHLMYLLDQVLLISRSDTGKLPCNPKQLNLREFCQDLVESLPVEHCQQRIQLSLTKEPQSASLDPALVRQILVNLLMNALKYSAADQPIFFKVICQPARIIFEVIDQGIGIPEAEQSHLFELFYRCSNVSAVRGSGLGLAVVKTCIDAHRGQIQIQSQLGQGTTVRVTLPLEPSPA